jgi:predicted ATPase
LVHETGYLRIDLMGRQLWVDGTHIPVGGYAFDLIGVLAQAAGAVVTKEELVRRVWSDVNVRDNTLQAHMAAVRRALGAHRDKLQTVARRGYRLRGEWSSHPGFAPSTPGGQPIASPDLVFKHNLPVATWPMIGRTEPVARVRDLLTSWRIVTLTGPGGIGKSALALEVARGLFAGFDGDCWLVEFASLSDAALLSSAVASVLGLKVGGDEISPETVARAIGRKKLMLVLDNCEHLIDEAARLAETIVLNCPNATVLATSRETLRVTGEYVYRVPPLDVPPHHLEAADIVREYSAAQLFIARMIALDPGFTVQPDRVPAIAAICRRLDGIPLAIEFAAARVATLGLQQMASHLDDRFRLLTAGRRTALPRHRTLRATLDWSYELLPEFERRLLRRLAIFAGGFTLESATAIMHDAGVSISMVADGIASLVAKSLVTSDRSLPSGRWRLLETIRAYAFDRLAETGEATQVARRHAEFFRDLVTPGEPGFRVSPDVDHLATYAREIDNLRAALEWAFAPGGDAEIGVAVTAAHCPLWLDLSLLAECRERVERALDHLAPDPKLVEASRMRLQITLGVTLIIMLGPAERAKTALTAGLDLAERLENRDAQVRALWALWALHFNLGEHRMALSIAERFARLAVHAEVPGIASVASRIIGYTLQYMGQQREARDSLENAMELGHGPTDQRPRSWFVYNQQLLARASLARSLWLRGLVRRAAELANTCLAEARALDDKLTLCFVLGLAVCPIALMTGDLVTAEQSVNTLIETATMQSFAQYLDVGRGMEATLLIEHGEFEVASARLRAILEARDSTGWRIGHPEYLGLLTKCHAGRGQPEEALTTVDRGLRRAEQGGERWYVPELLRIQGELLLGRGVGESVSAARDCFDQALGMAREQGALFWELRAALSLADLKIAQGRHEEARRAVTSVYDRLTEGFETADPRRARTLLDALSA